MDASSKFGMIINATKLAQQKTWMFDGAWTPSGLTIQINLTTNWKVLDADSPSMDLFGLPLKGKALFDLV
jgi:hypothetical protein